MSKPIIAVYVSSASDDMSPQFQSAYYALAYKELFCYIMDDGGEPIVVYEAERHYAGDGIFRKYWRVIRAGEDISFERKDEEIRADLVYDKNRFPFDDVRKVNPDRIKEVCNDKYLSYLMTPDFHPKSYLVDEEKQLELLMKVYEGKNVAIKELDSYGGDRVFVGEAQKYLRYGSSRLIFQEFIDTSGGAPGLAEGVHDVRVGLFNEEPICGLLRQPSKEGELRTNFNLGGTVRELYVREIPEELIEKTRSIGSRFGVDGPYFFSADWGFDNQSKTWRLFEINNTPGLAHVSEDGPAASEFLGLLAKKLVESAR